MESWDVGQLFERLDRIERLLERIANVPQQPAPFGIPLPVQPTWLPADRCAFCGAEGGHGNLPCPLLAPRCASTGDSAP